MGLTVGRQTWVGQALARFEDEALLRGEGRFIDDIDPVPNAGHAAIVRSQLAHARISGIDVSAALDHPGVIGVLTGAEVAATSRPFPVGVEDARRAVRDVAADAEEDELARLVWVARAVPEPRGLVVIVSAGTADGPVVREARVRAELLGTEVVVYEDVGVAGLHRLAAALPDLARAACVIVVAGMDAALASVVGGLVAAPVIGVPTSIGYGVADDGRTALNAMLASCAAALAVVGIDDGLGAGTIAARIARGRE